MEKGKDHNVPLYSTSIAYELPKATKGLFPEEDCGATVKVLEKIAGVEVRKTAQVL